MPNPGDIKYCDSLGGRETNAAFVWIPPGSFWMGDKRNQFNPVQFVVISKGFWLQQTPLTIAQFNRETGRLVEHQELLSSIRPVSLISWQTIAETFQGTKLRMPTNAEWEYAARGSVGYKYKYAGSNSANSVAWTKTKQPVYQLDLPRPVAQLKDNTFNLYDMSGNVREWCFDWERALTSQPDVDPKGKKRGTNRVARNGGFNADPMAVRVEFVNGASPNFIQRMLGVRLVWEI